MMTVFFSAASAVIVYAAGLANLSPDSVLNKTTALIFNLMTWGGVVIATAGVVLVARSLSASAEAEPREISKGISLVIAGIAMIAVRALIGFVIGHEPDRIMYFV